MIEIDFSEASFNFDVFIESLPSFRILRCASSPPNSSTCDSAAEGAAEIAEPHEQNSENIRANDKKKKIFMLLF